jgi:hypothetical protein
MQKTEKATHEKEVQKGDSLKDALRGVIEKQSQGVPSVSSQNVTPPTNQLQGSAAFQNDQPVFEVPEDVLRGIFKENI